MFNCDALLKKICMNFIIAIAFTGFVLISCKPRQFHDSLIDVLKTKEFSVFETYIDSLSKNDKQIEYNCDYYRDITNESKEGIFYFVRSIPSEDNIYIFSNYKYRILLITTNGDIVEYILCEEKYKQLNNKWVPYFDTIDIYKNDFELFKLKLAFKNIFDAELSDSELFNNDIVYGHSCGLTGIDPKEKIQIDEFVENRDKNSLVRWLKSTNTEKQIYAIDGLFQLKCMGLNLTTHEIKMIKYVIGKEGTINVCSGCEYFNENITDVTQKFKF